MTLDRHLDAREARAAIRASCDTSRTRRACPRRPRARRRTTAPRPWPAPRTRPRSSGHRSRARRGVCGTPGHRSRASRASPRRGCATSTRPIGPGVGRPSHAVQRHVELQMMRGGPEPEPPVDRGLRGEQRGHHLAALERLGAHALHQLAQDAAAPMGRQHADERDAGRRHERATRHDHPLREHARAADDPALVEGGERPIGLQDHPVASRARRDRDGRRRTPSRAPRRTDRSRRR